MNPLSIARAKLNAQHTTAVGPSSSSSSSTVNQAHLHTPAPRGTLPSFATPATPMGPDPDKRIQRLKEVFKVRIKMHCTILFFVFLTKKLFVFEYRLKLVNFAKLCLHCLVIVLIWLINNVDYYLKFVFLKYVFCGKNITILICHNIVCRE